MSIIHELRNAPLIPRNKPKKNTKVYNAHFMKIINKNGVFYISDEALQDEKEACANADKSFIDFLSENKLVIDKTKTGWKISKQKEFGGMKSIF